MFFDALITTLNLGDLVKMRREMYEKAKAEVKE
jgi:hypothetical protein